MDTNPTVPAVTTSDAIRATGLIKRYGDVTALDGLNLTVRTGEVHGFLGPNGAGKSTTIRVLLGLLRRDGGDANLLGGDPWRDAVALHGRLAYVPGDVNLWPNFSGGEVIDLFGSLRGGLDPRRRQTLLERFDLDPTRQCRTYSKGNRQKVALVAAFASDVDLYVLDEPTSGLDPLLEQVFQDCVREIKAAGKTILLSSHILAEAEALCDRVTIIRAGKDVETGTLAELRHLTRTAVQVETRQVPTGLEGFPGLREVTLTGTRASFTVGPETIDAVLRHLLTFDIVSLTSTPPTLEEVFMRYYGDTTGIPAPDGGWER